MDEVEKTSLLVARPATAADEIWLWDLYSTLLKPSIDAQWGWDELFQRTNFQEHLPYHLFSIIEKQNSKIAAYAAKTNRDKIDLHMLLVEPEYQSRGVGTYVLNLLKKRAKENSLPIALSIISANLVTVFYEKNGFDLINETSDKLEYCWIPSER